MRFVVLPLLVPLRLVQSLALQRTIDQDVSPSLQAPPSPLSPPLSSLYKEAHYNDGSSAISLVGKPSAVLNHTGGSHEDVEWHGIVDELMVLVQQRAIDKKIVFVLASEDWEQVLMNWIAHAHKVQLENYVIFALDKGLYHRLKRVDAPVFKFPIDQADTEWRRDLWLKRWVLMTEVLQRGIDVLHSDADAVLLRNPTELLSQETSDVVVSRGRAAPNWLLCMGFVYLRSTPSVLKLMNHVMQHMASSNFEKSDDQVSFNWVLRSKFHIKWSQDPYDSATSDKVIGTVAELPLQVSLLPNSLARRFHCSSEASLETDMIVAHCRDIEEVHEDGEMVSTELKQDVTSNAKKGGLADVGLWALRKHWRFVHPIHNWNNYVAAISNE